DLDLYLVTIVKHESGTAAPRHPQYGCRGRGSSKKCPYDSDYTSADDDSDDGDMFGPDYDDDDFESEDQEMDYKNDVETDVAAKNWVACIDKRMYLDLGIDIESELLCCDDDDDAEYNEEEAVELLFPGNEPDKREYEGYTGNYSPSLEFWYHRAVLVLWPASATMRTALRCGTHAALSAARQRSARYGATDTLPLADLATIVSLAEKKPEEYEFAKKDRYAAAVLDLCTGAGAAALDSSRRFLQLLAGGTPGAVENLDFRGAHSSAMVTLAMKLCSRGFQRLGKTEVKTFAQDVLWLAARVDGAGGLEQGFAGAVLTSLRSCDSSQVRKGYGKLKAVLESETVQATVRDGGGFGAVFRRTLVSERLKKLATIAPSVMTWRQPNAIFHEHPQVQQFLRGPEPRMTYTRSGTFSNKQHARNFARKYFSSCFSEPRHFSARCYEQGRGRGAYVRITKTTEFYDEDVRVYKEDTAEAAVLRGLLGNNKGSGRGRRGGGTAGGENGAAAAAAAGSTSAPPPSSVSGNASNGVGTVAAGKGRSEKVEVIDLCSD
ncbi:unnamed protein product, partial [Ectocarpus sp. 12 AP-2014]